MIKTDCIENPAGSPPSLTKPRRERIKRSIAPQKLKRLRQLAFLKKLSETGSVTQSAVYARINLCTPYHWCEVDPDFRGAMESPRSIGEQVSLATLEAEIQRRALAGKEDPGSTNLLMFRTKRLDPRYRDNVGVNVQINGPQALVFEVPATVSVNESKTGTAMEYPE